MDFQKYNIKEKKKTKSQKLLKYIYIYIYKICFKKDFLKIIVGYKNEN